MKSALLILAVAVIAALVYLALISRPPTSHERTAAEQEADYTLVIEGRANDIIKLLDLADEAKSNKVNGLIVAQYRALRERDEAIDAALVAAGKKVTYENRAERLLADSKPVHEKFIASLSEVLTPPQVEKVKDKMTYNKVQVTFDAYGQIVPGLTDEDKARILELLKLAREEAMDGGSASEKSKIFQKYKDQINDYLNAHGHDVAQAYKDWNAKQDAVKAAAGGTPQAVPAAQPK